jgi:hypothetical protein
VVLELALRFYNLPILSAKQNQTKAAKIGQRELVIAQRWHHGACYQYKGWQRWGRRN